MLFCPHKHSVRTVLASSTTNRHRASTFPSINLCVIRFDPDDIFSPPEPPFLQKSPSYLQQIAAGQPKEEETWGCSERFDWERCQMGYIWEVLSPSFLGNNNDVEAQALTRGLDR